MGLMTDAIIRETSELMRQKVRVKVIGNTGDLPEEVWHKLEGLIHRTAANTGVTLVLAFKLWSPLGNCRSCPEVDSRL